MTNRFGLSRADGHWAVQGRGQCYKCTVEKKRHEPLRDLSIDTISSTRARTWPRQDRFVSRGLERGRDGWAGPRNLLVITHTIPRRSLSPFLSRRRGQVTRIDGIVPRQSWCTFSEWNVDRFMEDCDPLGIQDDKQNGRAHGYRACNSFNYANRNEFRLIARSQRSQM